MTIIYNTNTTHNPNAYLTLAIRQAAETVLGVENVALADNRTLARLAARQEHDTLICLDGQRLDRPLLERVAPCFRTRILWLFEDPFMLELNRTNADLFDVVFTNDVACQTAYGGKGRYLPLGASMELHHRPVVSDTAMEYDLFFAGTMWPNRVETLRAVIRAFPALRLKLVCPTNPYLPPLPREIARRAMQGPISHTAFVDFAAASRVTLTLFRDYASHGDAGQASAPGPRLFELGLAGAAQVVEIGDAMPEKHFSVVDGVACCDGTTALLAEIEHLIASPALREERARTAQESVARAHLYEHRMREIAALAGVQMRRRPVDAATPDRATPVQAGGKLRIMMCTHSTLKHETWGGVEVYQQILASGLADSIDIFYWLRRDESCMLLSAGGQVLERFEVPRVEWLDALTDADEETAFSRAIAQYAIDVVHFQHLGHHAASLPVIARGCGVGTVWSIHDFYLVCARYNLLDQNLRFCDIGHRDIAACDNCLRVAEGVPAGAQSARRAFMAEMLRSVDVLLYGSRHSEQLSLQIYPGLADQRRLVLGIPTLARGGDIGARQAARDKRTPLKIAVLGNFLRSKGADTVLGIIGTVNPTLFEFHIIGQADAGYEEVLSRSRAANVTYHGRYSPGQPTMLDQCDVALFLSIWPETFCISLSEAWQKGLVPIVTAIGALGERVTHGVDGFTVPVNDDAAVIGYLELLRADPRRLAVMRTAIRPELWVDGDAHAQAILDVYRSIAPRARLATSALRLDVGRLHLLAHERWRVQRAPRHIIDPLPQSDVALDPPETIRSWAGPDDLVGSIDYVGIHAQADIAEGVFETPQAVDIGGWAFLPEMGLAGQASLVLIGDGDAANLFIKAERRRRDDVRRTHPHAPADSGFHASCTLHGKWSDGQYRVGLINSFGDRAAFHLFPLQVELREGRIRAANLTTTDNIALIHAFDHVVGFARQDLALPLRSPPTSRLRFRIDFVGSNTRTLKSGPCLTPGRRELYIRGWAFASEEPDRDAVRAVCLVREEDSRILAWSIRRHQRPDVRLFLKDAPDLCGFSAAFRAEPELTDGHWIVGLAVESRDGGTIEPVGLRLHVRRGRFHSIDIIDVEAIAAGHPLPPQLTDAPTHASALRAASDKPAPPLARAGRAQAQKRVRPGILSTTH